MDMKMEHRKSLPRQPEQPSFGWSNPLFWPLKVLACDIHVCSLCTITLSAAIVLLFCFVYFDIIQAAPTGLLLNTAAAFRTFTLNAESYEESSKSSPYPVLSHPSSHAAGDDNALAPSPYSSTHLMTVGELAGSPQNSFPTKQAPLDAASKDLQIPDWNNKSRHSDRENPEISLPTEKTIEAPLSKGENPEISRPAEKTIEAPVDKLNASHDTMESDMSTDDQGGEKEEKVLSRSGECNLFVGRWVWDESYPIYRSEACPFIDGGFRCQENGRPDQGYLKWRWQPSGCDMPRFNAKDMLERLRGSRLVFVGDSLGRNQWESMMCMLAEGIQNKSRIYEVNGEPITKHTGFLSFRFEDYDCTVEYYRSPFLVPQGHPPRDSPKGVRLSLRVDTMDWSSKRWVGADVIVFNAGHWWSYEKTLRGGCYFQEGQKVNTSMDVRAGFGRAMRTWREWVEREMGGKKTKVFFRSYAPVHFSGGTWKTGGQCHEETHPSPASTRFQGTPWSNQVVLSQIELFRNQQVHLLDITHLSNYRKDAHASIYHVGKEEPRPLHRQDCSHWCLPGLPDTWNELLYASLLAIGDGVWKTRTTSSR